MVNAAVLAPDRKKIPMGGPMDIMGIVKGGLKWNWAVQVGAKFRGQLAFFNTNLS